MTWQMVNSLHATLGMWLLLQSVVMTTQDTHTRFISTSKVGCIPSLHPPFFTAWLLPQHSIALDLARYGCQNPGIFQTFKFVRGVEYDVGCLYGLHVTV